MKKTKKNYNKVHFFTSFVNANQSATINSTNEVNELFV